MSVPSIRGHHLHLDGVSGAAGDMFLAAMIDLGVPESVIGDAIGALRGRDDVPLGLELQVRAVVRGGISATDVKILVDGKVAETALDADARADADAEADAEADAGAGAEADAEAEAEADADAEAEAGHGRHSHRHYREIRQQVATAPLDAKTVSRALDIFDRLARAEAAIHGTSIEDVAFHELGALDALGDIVGAAAALTWLDPASVSSAPIHVGCGQVRTAHGWLPVPSPAALSVLREAGAKLAQSMSYGEGRELCTPTGAAILASAVTDWATTPAHTVVSIGYGAGDLELRDRPNVLRASVGHLELQPPISATVDQAIVDQVILLETNIDDLSAELCAHAGLMLAHAGALDVWWTPITTKKSRPAMTLSVLARLECKNALLSILWAETSTLGVRVQVLDRELLERTIEIVETRYGPVEVKLGLRHGRVVNVAPEYESCAKRARQQQVPVKRVYAAALAAFEAAFEAVFEAGGRKRDALDVDSIGGDITNAGGQQ